MLPNFIAKTRVANRNCLSLDGEPVLDRFQLLRDGIIGVAGREAAALFAEPVASRKGVEIEIAWYGQPEGDPRPLASLDADLKRILGDKLRARLQAMAPLLADTRIGPLLARALYVADAGDILAVGQEPVLVRWGILPDGVDAADRAHLTQHFAATLGPYAPFAAPRIDGTAAVRAADASEGEGSPGSLGARRRRAWLPASEHRAILLATVIAAAITLLMTLPGILAVPARTADADDATLPALKLITKAMQDKIDQARAALAAADCAPDGTIQTKPGKNGAPEPLPPTPSPVRPEPVKAQGDMALVAKRATQSVVFIFVCKDRDGWEEDHKNEKDKGQPTVCPEPVAGSGKPAPDATQVSGTQLFFAGSGSGFFIGPRTVVTNMHVVRGAKSVFVTNRSLGQVHPAVVKAATVKQKVADPDFAVVELDADPSPEPIGLSLNVSRLQNVVSAGYPGIIIEEDEQLRRLVAGDMAAAPELTTFPGFVTLTMNQDTALPLIFSSAVIGHGNSGGPLLDLCANAVGMNTLGWSGEAEDAGYKVNVAEGSKALMSFLDNNHIAYRKAEGECGAAPASPPSGDKPPGQGPSSPPAPAPGPVEPPPAPPPVQPAPAPG